MTDDEVRELIREHAAKAHKEHEQRNTGKRPLALNKDVAIAGLKSVAAAGLGTAAGYGIGRLANAGLERLGWPKDVPTKTLIRVGTGLGTAMGLGYALNKRLNREYLEDAYERSKADTSDSIRVGGKPAAP